MNTNEDNILCVNSTSKEFYGTVIQECNKNVVYLFTKRVFDIICSSLALIILSPLMAVIALIIYAEDGYNPFYMHERVGKNGKLIKIYKFRSMKKYSGKLEDILTPEQIEQYNKEFKIDNDPRITSIGKFIRNTSIDELPQLFNIIKGDLSVIGPRPIVKKELEFYENKKDLFLSVKPGLTGYWQAYARNNATYESGKRQQMELYYVQNCSWKLDIAIFFRTIISVLKQDGAQ